VSFDFALRAKPHPLTGCLPAGDGGPNVHRSLMSPWEKCMSSKRFKEGDRISISENVAKQLSRYSSYGAPTIINGKAYGFVYRDASSVCGDDHVPIRFDGMVYKDIGQYNVFEEHSVALEQVMCNTNITATVVKSRSKDVDVSDWRAWSHKAEGDCPCGIARQVCHYHR
jgi:hypothetical protein